MHNYILKVLLIVLTYLNSDKDQIYFFFQKRIILINQIQMETFTSYAKIINRNYFASAEIRILWDGEGRERGIEWDREGGK